MTPRLRIASEPVDPFRGAHRAGDEYDPHRFYVRATNKHDHSFNTRLRLDPEVVAEVQRVIANGSLAGTEIGSLGDFIRDAMYHRMKFLSGMIDDGHFIEAAEDVRRLAVADSIVRDQQTKTKIVQDARDAVEGGIAARDHTVVTQLIELYEPMVERLREPYAEQLTEALKTARRWCLNAK